MEYVFCEALPWKFMKNMLQTFADHWHTARRSYSTHSWIFAIFTWDKCSVKLIFSVLLTNRTVSNLLFFLGEEHVTRGLQCCTAAIKKPRLESSFYHPDEQDECKYAGGWYEVFHYKGGIHSFNLCTKDFRLYIYIYIFSDCFLGKPLLLSQNPWNHLSLNQVRVKQEPAVDTLTLGIAKGQFQNLRFDLT